MMNAVPLSLLFLGAAVCLLGVGPVSGIMQDTTPPNVGTVTDILLPDVFTSLDYQTTTSKICVRWTHFYDDESGTDRYLWGVGQTNGSDDTVSFHSVSNGRACADVTLEHNVTYFSTIVAYNRANLSTTGYSDGVLVDATPPLGGVVTDGRIPGEDVNFTSESASVFASWSGFEDPESGLKKFEVKVLVNGEVKEMWDRFKGPEASAFEHHSFILRHSDKVVVQVHAYNWAGDITTVESDGVLVDHTDPVLVEAGPKDGISSQSRTDVLDFTWRFRDLESGLEYYLVTIKRRYEGQEGRFWPKDAYSRTMPHNYNLTIQMLHLDNLKLTVGALYFLKVYAVNKAKGASSYESSGVKITSS